MRHLLRNSLLILITGLFFSACSGAKPVTAVFWKKNPYKLNPKDKKDEVDYHLSETEGVIEESQEERDRHEREELKRIKREKAQELELAKKEARKIRKVNDGTFKFY